MDDTGHLFISIWINLFFLLTPVFVFSVFLSLTQEFSAAQRRTVAAWLTFDVMLICFALYFLGNAIFSVFGITLDAFRIGAGVLLFLSAVDLVRGNEPSIQKKGPGGITVVPLSIPITVGPATTGALLVMGAELETLREKSIGCTALVSAVLCVGILLFLATSIERVMGTPDLKS